MLNTIRATCLAVALALLAPAMANASLVTLSNLFAFGDSLSDGGNFPPGPVFPPFPYAGARYSNGPTAVEYLWQAYNPGNPGGFTPSNTGGTNYALGGATTGHLNFNSINPSVPVPLQPVFQAAGGMLDQIAQFSAGCNACFNPGTSLFVVWGFPNDVFINAALGPLGLDAATLISMGVQNITTGIMELAAEGAQHFLVPNMVDLGATPGARGTPAAAGLTALTLGFNAVLAGALTSLDLALSAEIVQFDTYSRLQNVLLDPAAYGFSNVTDQCILNLGNPANPCDPATWLFWDGVHPTTAGHSLLGAQFAAAVPEPAILALYGLGLAGLAFSRRRRA